MEKYMEVIKKCPLFTGMDLSQLRTLFDCLLATTQFYEKQTYILSAGSPVTTVGIILSGEIHILQEDFWGNRTILARGEAGDLFGEAFSCAEIKHLPISVLAVQPSHILMIDYHRIITTCSSACIFHATLIQNMLRILAAKNVMLTQKIEFLTKKTTREKLLAYLSAQAQQAGNAKFQIPFNRQELAEYLSVERSAMSSTLSKMQAEGILAFHKNEFHLLTPPPDTL